MRYRQNHPRNNSPLELPALATIGHERSGFSPERYRKPQCACAQNAVASQAHRKAEFRAPAKWVSRHDQLIDKISRKKALYHLALIQIEMIDPLLMELRHDINRCSGESLYLT